MWEPVQLLAATSTLQLLVLGGFDWGSVFGAGGKSFPFPPVPAVDWIELAARVTLASWLVVGSLICIIRWTTRKSIQPTEGHRWLLAALISFVLVVLCLCRPSPSGNNAWPILLMLAAFALSTLGTAVHSSTPDGAETDRGQSALRWGPLKVMVGVWITTILILGFLMLPSTSHHAEAYHRTACKNNLKLIGLAMHNYHDDKMSFPPAASGSPLVSWRVAILPYLDQQRVYAQYDRSSAWNQTPNLPLTRQPILTLVCPSDPGLKDSEGVFHTAYAMLTGPHSIGGDPRGTKFANITDGTSNTLLVVEACGAGIVWSEPRDIDITVQKAGINLNGQRPGQSSGWLSSYHSRGAQVLFADGAARFLPADIDPVVLQKLATIDGGETVDGF